MRKAILIAAVAALLLVALPIGAAGATTPQDVTFDGPSFFPTDGPGSGFFTATGPAVDSGAICPSGATLDVFGKPAGFESPNGFNLQIVKEFTCDDGSGTFFVKLQVRIDYEKWPTFNWVVVDGTGDYEELKGNGYGYGLFPIFNGVPDPIGVWDVYEGKLH